MFGKPQWFVSNSPDVFLRPKTWQGWVYHATWAIAAWLPAMTLASAERFPEAFLWLAMANGGYLWDMRNSRRETPISVPAPAATTAKAAAKGDTADILYIGEEVGSHMATSGFDLRLK